MKTMTEKRYDKDNPRFRDEFGCVNDLLTGESYTCGESAMVGERDALDTAIALCELLNKQDQRIKELEKLIQNLIIEFFKPPCANTNDRNDVLNKFLNEEYGLSCIEVEIDVNGGNND